LSREVLKHPQRPPILPISNNDIGQDRFCKLAWSLSLIFLTIGCVSRAPTDCELDKRSGLYPSSFCEGNADKSAVGPTQRATAANVKPNEIPVRSEPLVKRVWIHDQILEGGHWMQGTWAYIEVEPSKWVGTSTRSSNQVNTTSLEPDDTSVPVSEKATPENTPKGRSSTRVGSKQ
jgi:hypothetical protein